MRELQQLETIAQQCRDYAILHNCTKEEALGDWEGDGPNGSFGLDYDSTVAVWALLGYAADDDADYYEY